MQSRSLRRVSTHFVMMGGARDRDSTSTRLPGEWEGPGQRPISLHMR